MNGQIRPLPTPPYGLPPGSGNITSPKAISFPSLSATSIPTARLSNASLNNFNNNKLDHPNAPIRQRLEMSYDQSTHIQTFTKGEAIPLRDNHIWIIQRGVVLLTTLYATGDESLLGLAGPSLPFGLPLSYVYPYQANAFSAVEAFSVSMAEVENSPRLLQALQHGLSHRLRQAEMMIALLGHRRVEDRLRGFLILLSHETGQITPMGNRIGLRLTHQHLANALGTTRVTVTRLINQLRDENWLSFDATRHIVLHSVDRNLKVG
jgi:CRP-like cAMP-binding protein